MTLDIGAYQEKKRKHAVKNLLEKTARKGKKRKGSASLEAIRWRENLIVEGDPAIMRGCQRKTPIIDAKGRNERVEGKE